MNGELKYWSSASLIQRAALVQSHAVHVSTLDGTESAVIIIFL